MLLWCQWTWCFNELWCQDRKRRQVAEVEEIGGTNATEAFNAAKISRPKALHGSPACVIADSYLLLLRRAATKAIRINGAGQTPCSDLVCLVTWKKTLAFTRSHTLWQPSGELHARSRKSPDLIPMWKMRHITFEGRLLPGPFAKLVTCLNKIGWSISDPLQVQDHEQHEWHLDNVGEKTPHALLMDVWCQHLASQRPCATLWAWI